MVLRSRVVSNHEELVSAGVLLWALKDCVVLRADAHFEVGGLDPGVGQQLFLESFAVDFVAVQQSLPPIFGIVISNVLLFCSSNSIVVLLDTKDVHNIKFSLGHLVNIIL